MCQRTGWNWSSLCETVLSRERGVRTQATVSVLVRAPAIRAGTHVFADDNVHFFPESVEYESGGTGTSAWSSMISVTVSPASHAARSKRFRCLSHSRMV